MDTSLFKMKTFLAAIFFAFSILVLAQSPDYLMSGDYTPPASWSTASAMSASAGSSKILISTPSGTGNKYFRFYSAASGGTSYGPSGGSDLALTSGTSSALQVGSTFAYYLNIANAASNVVFKTWGTGAPGSSSAVAFEVQGSVRQATTVTQNISASSVVAGQAVTVTATLNGAFATGQAAYLRYSTDNFSTSTVVPMTGSGTSYTANIPASANTAAATVKYYVFTSTSVSANVLTNGTNADNFTINLNNNSGSNYSYTVNTPGAIYLNNFPAGSTTTTCTDTPTTLNSNLTTTGWTLGSGVFNTANGNGGTASSLATSAVANSPFTLKLNVASGYQLSISSFNYWRQSSQSTNSVTSITVNGTTITSGSVAVPTTGALIGQTNVANAINGLTGTVTIVINFGGGTGSFRIDDFTLNGNVVAIAPAVAPTITSFTASAPGSGTSGYVGNTVTVTGTGFTGVSSVKVGGSAGTVVTPFTIVDDSHITFTAQDVSGAIYVLNSAGNATSSVSYTSLGYITQATGTWQTTGTWLGGVVPPSATTTNVTIAHNVTGTTGTINVGALKVNGGITLTNTSGAIINLNSASTNLGTITNGGTVTTAAAITNSGTFTNNGTFQINASGSISAAPVYGSSSTLIYNAGTYNVGVEWTTGTTATVGTGIPQNVTILSGTVNTLANKALAGNLVISASTTLNLGGDFYIGGNWSDAGTFTPNTKAVFFAGTGTSQTITNTNATNSNTETFNYLVINNSNAAGVVKLLSNVAINSTAGDVLQLTNSSSLDLAGKTLTLSGDGGNILASGGVRNIISSVTNGLFSIAGSKVVTSAGSGTLVLGNTANPSYLTTELNKGLNFGSGNLTTVNSILQIKANGFVDVNTPKYANTSTLVYNAVNPYSVNIEWIGNATTSGVGIPQNVSLINSNITMPAGARGMAGTLTIDSGSTLNLEGTIGSDLNIAGNLANSGILNTNARAVSFNGALPQTITGATTFDYLTLSNSSGLTLSGTTSSVLVNKTLTLSSGKITLGSNNLTLASLGVISGASATNYVVTNGAGQLKQTIGSTAVAFPVGSLTLYNPIIFTNAGTSDVYGVVLTAGTVPNTNDATLTVNDRWLVSEAVSGGSNLTVVPQWNTSDLNNATNFNAGTQLYVGFYNGSSWTQNSAAVSGSNPYTATGAADFAPATLSGTQYFAVGKDNAFKCGALNVPYTQNFDSVTIPAMPGCWTIQDVNNDGTKWSTDNINYNTSPNSLVYSWNVTNAANDWAYTPGLNLTAGTAYRISFKYAVGGATLPEKLKIGYGTSAVDTSMTTIADLGTLTNTAYSTASYDFVPSATGVYYVGFNAYSDANMYYLSIDDVSLTISPPTLLVNGTSAATINFGSNDIGSTVTPQSFSLSGANLSGYPSNITVTAPNANFQVSSDAGSTWGTSVNVPYTTATLAAKNILIKYIPTACGVVTSGNLTFSGGGVSTYPTVAVSGTAILAKPINLTTTDITATTFTANWGSVSGATGYVIDVSTNSNFSTASTGTTTELFESSTPVLPTAYQGSATNYTFGSGVWSLTDVIKTTSNQNSGTQGLQLKASTGTFTSPSFSSPTTLSFYAKRGTNANTLVVNKIVNGVTTQLLSQALTTSMVQYSINVNDTSSDVKIQFVNGGNVGYVDDFSIGYNTLAPSFVSPYNNYSVGNVNSTIISGLQPNTQYYYRLRASSGSCQSPNSDVQGVLTNNTVIWNSGAWSNTTGPSATLDGIIRSSYVVGADATQPTFTVKNLTVESTGLLEIKAGQGVSVAGTITTADNKIVIDSDGSLLQTNSPVSNDNSGKITAKRDVKMSKMDYTYWSTPVTGQKLLDNSGDGFSVGTPNNRIYDYYEPTDTFKATADANFMNAKAYAIRGKDSYSTTVHTSDTNLKFVGTPNNGSYTIGVQKSKNTVSGGVTYTHGYNLIGNPYPSNINFIQFYNLDKGDGTKNSDVINAKAWFWTNSSPAITQSGSAYSGNNYATITLAGGTPPTTAVGSATNVATPNEFIKVAQGFIIEMKGTAPTTSTPITGTLKFDNTIRTNNSTGHFYNNNKSSSGAINRYWLKLTSPQNVVNTILLAHMDEATNAYDPDYDAELLTIGDDSFYSKLNTQKLQIQARNNQLITEDVIPLGTKYAANGTYKLSLGDKEGIFEADQKIYLKDKLNNTYTDITSQDYSFAANKGTDESRFEIVYKENAVLGTGLDNKSDFIVYKDGESYVIKSSKSLGKIEIYDTAGRMLITSSTQEKSIKIDASVLPNGLYIIKAENSGDVKTKKVIR